MARFRFARRRRFGRMVRRARPIVRAATGITLAKRFIFNGVSVPAISAAAFDNPVQIPLVECVETMDEEVESDGAGAVADVPLYSKLMSLKANLILQSSITCVVRWMLHKLPDGEELITDANRLTNTGFHSSDDTNPFREFRKMQVAKGFLVVPADKLAAPVRIFVRKQAWKRIAPMRENDVLRLDIAQSTNATVTLHGFGTLYAKANA